jgi:hypothetical protein
MKGFVLLFCISAGLLLILVPGANAACNRSVPPQYPILTDWTPPGPDGSIYVESSPTGAVIYMNDINEGHAPATITNLWPGTYTITAKMSGYQDFTSVTTISGATRSSVFCPMVPDSSGNGLYVVSTPANANVYLDGTLKGLTPLMLSDTAAGNHTIDVRLYGYGDWKSTVDVNVGGTKTVSAILKAEDPGSNQGINVSSKPAGAKVMLDGLAKGVTPISLNGIASGIHILEIGYTGYTSWKSTIDVPETGIKEISVNLTPTAACSPGWITVFSSPENARVTLDGNYAGLTTHDRPLNLDAITPGEHTIVLELTGFTPYSTQVTVVSNQVSLVNATLLPVSGQFAKGTLSVTSDPAGATIFVDNISIGITPFTVNDITAGDHQVIIHSDGYSDYSAGILVTAGTTRPLSARLLKVTPTLHSPVSPFAALGALGIICFITLKKRK